MTKTEVTLLRDSENNKIIKEIKAFVAVLRIRYIFCKDPYPRIRTLWLTDPAPNHCVLSVIFSTATKKLFCLYFLKIHLHHFSKIKSHKPVGIKVILTIFAWWQKDPNPYLWLMDPDQGGPKIYESGSATLLCRVLSDSSVRVHLDTKKMFSSFFLYIFSIWRAGVCWPPLCLCRPFCIFERCLD